MRENAVAGAVTRNGFEKRERLSSLCIDNTALDAEGRFDCDHMLLSVGAHFVASGSGVAWLENDEFKYIGRRGAPLKTAIAIGWLAQRQFVAESPTLKGDISARDRRTGRIYDAHTQQ